MSQPHRNSPRPSRGYYNNRKPKPDSNSSEPVHPPHFAEPLPIQQQLYVPPHQPQQFQQFPPPMMHPNQTWYPPQGHPYPPPQQHQPYGGQGSHGGYQPNHPRAPAGSPYPASNKYGGRGTSNSARGGRKNELKAPPPVRQERIYLYDKQHLENSYNTNHESSTAEKGERWWENPKNYLQFIYRAVEPTPKMETVQVAGLPTNWVRMELKVQTPDPELIITGRGDGKNKKDAENNCALDMCYQVEKHSLIEYYRQFGRTKKTVIRNPKEWTVNYFTNKQAGLPRYVHKPDATNNTFICTVKLDEIVGTGKGSTAEEAEMAAATQFQQMAVARGVSLVLAVPGSAEEPGLTVDVAKKFIDYYIRVFNHAPPLLEYSSTGKTHQALWQADLIMQGIILGTGKKRSKKDAENMAYVDAAVNVKKDIPSIWTQFETTKDSRGKHAEVARSPPTVHLELDDRMRDEVEHLMNTLSREEFFRAQRPTTRPETPDNISDRTTPGGPPRRNNRQLVGKLDEQQMAGKSARLFDQYQNYLKNPAMARLRQSRAVLPIAEYTEEITSKIRDNDVVVLVGQTGCGKTTQLPQIILDDYIKSERGGVCNIICTQPRRIAAISVAQRVAVERGERLGQSVGYQVRFDNQSPAPGGSILYCTTGIFLRMMHNEGTQRHDPLGNVTHIVVDEVHERDIDTDFLLVLLRQTQRERRAKNLPSIKLILMSATIDTGMFATYFGEGFPNGQCPSIAVPGRTFPVQQYYLDDLLDSMYKEHPQRSMVSFQRMEQTQRYIAREMQIQPVPSANNSMNSNNNSNGQHFSRLSSARFDDDADSDVDDGDIDLAESMQLQAKKMSRNVSRMPRDEVADAEIPAHLIAHAVAHIVKSSPPTGAILCFLSGWEDIQEVDRQLRAGPLGIDFNDSNLFRVHMLHSNLPSISQQEVFEPLEDPKMRKIILATNIAETSITIQDVVHVVDSAKVKETNYDPIKRMTTLLPTWISASSLKQRAGRAGRVQEGQYYCMMSKKRRELLDDYSIPEMLRSDLQEICLHIKSVDVSTKIAGVLAEAIQPPDEASVVDALTQLTSLGALDKNENLTPLGRVLATLPVEPSFGRCLILSCIFRCLDPVLTLCASLGTKDVFLSPMGKKEQADAAKMMYAGELGSDHLAMMNAYNAWQKIMVTEPHRSFAFTDAQFLSRQALENIKRAKSQLLDLLEKAGVVPPLSFTQARIQREQAEMGPAELNVNSKCIPLLRSMVCAGVFPNVSYKTSKRIHRTRHDNTCIVHPGSVNSTRGEKFIRNPNDIPEQGSLFAFSTKVRTGETQIFLRNTTRLDPVSMLLFAGENDVEPQGYNLLIVDEWWRFNGSDRTIRTLRSLREMMVDGFEKMFVILDEKSQTRTQRNYRMRDLLMKHGTDVDTTFDSWMNQPAMNRLVEGVVQVLETAEEDLRANNNNGANRSGNNSGRNSAMDYEHYSSSSSGGAASGYGLGTGTGIGNSGGGGGGYYGGGQGMYRSGSSGGYGGSGGGGYSNGSSRPGSRSGYNNNSRPDSRSGGGGTYYGGNPHQHQHQQHHHQQQHHHHPAPPPPSMDPREMWGLNPSTGGGQSWF